ncbi:hypothetical protein ROLI_044670 [Roseobacter fucihabitans]|uniref:DUF2254 domain-containing protein n=1 Tax=Roseobacter fucihabitans TaxID=1537242 RepID=A0ABZ2C035_9RHOB|nr:DUF2254 domain-containing protein [Roseobacter litoralis]MBC6963946.1 hypothetical protein [Roseobacter litoralis]MBC6963969.1 hypothetical protein [Roseobacter litoralis]
MKYRAKLLQLAQAARASYWFLPASMVLFTFVLANLVIWIDRSPDMLPFQLPDRLSNTQIEGARSTLSTIATSVIGVTGVMFSMTVVAVSFAAGTYGPRLIGNFMRDRGNQISLGILISTFVFSLLVLRVVQSPIEDGEIAAFVPHYSLLLAIAGSIVAVFAMIYFVHHVPETINVSNITANLGHKLERDIRTIIEVNAERGSSDNATLPDTQPDRQLKLPIAGYIQVLRYSRIKELSEEKICDVEILCFPGEFVTRFTPVLNIWQDENLTDEDMSELHECFAVGTNRTEHQNIYFLVDQLVEMLARALSPGVNDPFTAINCLNWMHNALKAAQLHENGMQNKGVRTSALGPILTYDKLLERSFKASKPYCEPDHLVMARYNELMQDLNETSMS